MTRALAIGTLSLTSLVACGGSDSGSDGSTAKTDDATTVACKGQCDAQGAAKNCASQAISVADCKSLCESIVPSLSTDCKPKAEAAYACGAKAGWSCAMGGNLPIADGGACQAELSTYAMCTK